MFCCWKSKPERERGASQTGRTEGGTTTRPHVLLFSILPNLRRAMSISAATLASPPEQRPRWGRRRFPLEREASSSTSSSSSETASPAARTLEIGSGGRNTGKQARRGAGKVGRGRVAPRCKGERRTVTKGQSRPSCLLARRPGTERGGRSFTKEFEGRTGVLSLRQSRHAVGL